MGNLNGVWIGVAVLVGVAIGTVIAAVVFVIRKRNQSKYEIYRPFVCLSRRRFNLGGRGHQFELVDNTCQKADLTSATDEELEMGGKRGKEEPSSMGLLPTDISSAYKLNHV